MSSDASLESDPTPEQRKAIKVLQDCLPKWQEYLCYDITEKDICFTDFIAYSPQKITYSDVRHGTDWTWNQSNSKRKVMLENDVLAVIQKFNTRKIQKDSLPIEVVFKLWMFTIYKHTENINSFMGVFVWCEKGLSEPNIDEYGFPAPETNEQHHGFNYDHSVAEDFSTHHQSTQQMEIGGNVTLADLRFLKPFIDKNKAISYGW